MKSESRAAVSLPPADQRWVDGLAAGGCRFEQTCRDLHPLLIRTARYEIRRLSVIMRMSGPEPDDIACQAASDALLLVIAKAGEFRGDSKFTTWAAGFASFEARSKLRQYLGWQDRIAATPEHWEHIADPAPGPDREAEAHELASAIRHVIDTRLPPVQRAAFTGVVLSGDVPEAIAASLGTNANAVYQAVFRARRNLRDELAASGFLHQPAGQPPNRKGPAA